ncbi:uncharacterized protein LOC135386308 [Ornithodoros turicata]|uniref:uncharacterized protein LOC135386308 n=1 Tax=Ornithodoros turicata TaxID=34597 RepID=UPI003138B022
MEEETSIPEFPAVLCERLVASGGCSSDDFGECWVLDNLLSWNKLLWHIGVQLLEKEPGQLVLESYRIVQGENSCVSFALKMACLLLKRHCCVRRFSFEAVALCILEPLLRVLSQRAYVQGLVLGNVSLEPSRSFGLEKSIIQLIQEVVEASKNLDHFEIDLQDTTDSCVSALGEILAKKGSLRKLCFNGCCEALLSSYLRTLRRMIVKKVLREFNVEYLTLGGCNSAQAKHLYVLLSSNESIVSLDLTGHYLTDDTVNVEWNSNHCLRDEGVLRVATALKCNGTVQSLKLEDCGFGRRGARALADMLSTNQTLQHLDITYNRMDNASCRELAAAIRSSTTLKELRVEGTGYSSAGVQYILAGLKENTSGLVVDFGDISQNTFSDVTMATEVLTSAPERSLFTWTERCIAKLRHLLYHQKQVRSIHFDCDDENKDAFRFLCCYLQRAKAHVELLTVWFSSWDDDTCELLSECLLKNTRLRSLWVYSPEMEQCNFAAICDALKGNETLAELCIHNNGVLDERHDGARCFAGVLSKNKTLQTFELSVPFDEDDLEQFFESMKNNYAVTRFVCRGSAPLAMKKVEQLVKRNCVLQEQAVHFVLQGNTPCKRHWASAFQLTYDTGTLERCLVDRLKKTPQEVRCLLRVKMFFLHANYFKITRVVKDSIVCRRVAGSTVQLDMLGTACLVHIASFLNVLDVRW